MLVRYTHLRAEDLVERFGSAILADTVSVTDKQLLSNCTRTIIPQERFCFCAIPEESACHEVLTRSACYYRRHADINAE